MGVTRPVRDDEVSIKGLRLHYREWGDPAMHHVLILHGLTGHAWEFDGLAEQLSTNYHVVALNQRGHGASQWASSYLPSEMADDVASTIETLQLTGARVIGHSMGGINGWNCAARRPDLIDRLVILDVGPDVLAQPEVQRMWLDTLEERRLAAFASPEQAVVDSLGEYDGPTAGLLRQYVLDNLIQREDGAWIWRYDAEGFKTFIEGTKSSTLQWKVLRSVTCPALILRAGESWALQPATAERMDREMPNASYVEIAGSGHDIHFDQPEALLREVIAFWEVDGPVR